MGAGRFDPQRYAAFTSTTRGKTTEDIYTARSIDPALDPKGVKIRESRDSADNPNSTPLIVAIDVTGSMGIIADVLARKGLGTLFNEILEHKPITDPHVMFMAVGDARCDKAPLQVSQFEADNRIVDQLTRIWIEHGGGGNAGESYNLPWYFAARHTDIDCLIKRGKRGYLFTVGDEPAPPVLSRAQIAEFVGDTEERDITPEEILAEAQRKYDVFHIIIEEGEGRKMYGADRIFDGWVKLLGERVIRLPDHTKLSETIVAAITVAEGAGKGARFGGMVFDAVKHLPQSRTPVAALPA